ncbi:PorV/PorQ family protein [candidate division FCPU426 bacterium]|nr:PorV/PorQ family protein [candidate division FCPU426 bacterium]
MRRLTAIIAICLFFPVPSFALSGKGTTAASFLKIGVGPRAVAMGEAYVAVANDVSALYWNPAGLARLSCPEITAMHVFWLENIFFDHLAGAMPLATGVAGASLVYLNSGDIIRSEEGDTPDDPERGRFSASDIGFTGGYSLAFGQNLFIGANILLFSETIDANASFGWACDLGFLYQMPWPGITLGAVIQNLGPATKVDEEYFRMPINFKIGLGWMARSDIQLTLDYNQLLEQNGKVAFGAEYFYEQTLALRAGYVYQGKIDNAELYSGYGTNAIAGVTAGMGVKYQNFSLDYAFVPYGFLGTTHRIAVSYQFAPIMTSAVSDK